MTSVFQVIENYPVVYPQDVALLLKVSEWELRGAFHLLTGRHLNEYIAERRVKRAAATPHGPMTRKQWTVWMTDVAHHNGWQSIAAMDKTFRKVTGHTARWWLKHHEPPSDG